jgi:phage tail sheath gpL-like
MDTNKIKFDNIPSGIRKPGKYLEFNTKLAVRTLPANAQKMLIIAQRLAAGTVDECVPTQVFSDAEAAAYFGEGSIAHLMVRAAIKANPYLDLSVCAPAETMSDAVARVHTLLIGGPATGSGNFTLSIDSDDYEVAVSNEETAADIATALKAALDNDTGLAWTVTKDTATLTFTAKTAGAAANAVIFDKTITATGVTGTFTATQAGVDPASTCVPRVHALALSGPATGSGVLSLYVGNVRYQIGITSSDTATAIGTALKALLDNDPALPFDVNHTTGTLTFTAKNGGTVPNQIDFAVEITATGVAGTFSVTTAGSIDPPIATALAAVSGEQYDIIASPYFDATSYAALKTHLDLVSGPMEQRPGVCIIADDDALGTVTTLTSTINSGRILCAYLRGTKSPAYEIAAAFGAVMAWEEDPARPLNTLALTGIAAPPIASRLSRTEQESCLANGATPLEVGPGEVVQIVRAISTYVHDAQGIDDVSLLDITTIRTLDYVRKAIRTRIALRFPREKLSSKTPEAVRDQIMDVLYQLEDLEIVEEVEANADGVIVERDDTDANRLNAKIPCDVVNGLHVFAGRIDLLL